MIQREKLQIIGISVRTTNRNNQVGADLGELWSRLFSENILKKIPNKLSNDIYCVYTDYESNYTGTYTALLGLAVSSLDAVPAGLIAREFEADAFQHFQAVGTMPNAVMQTWLDIWKNDSKLNRKYSYDLEVYGEKSQQGGQSEVDIYLAIKS